ncbi:hypothetical protein ACIGCP_14425 [Cellulophaga baltica]|uniref:hypothetical protein n=1 Tax=Cellulophaga baltica TaxID=76594 RepID=UPI0037CBC33C
MLRILKKINWMIILWIVVILFGTTLTIWGSAKFNDEWTKKDSLRQLHTIPDFLLLDFEVEAELDSLLTEKILSEVKPKIHIHGDSIENLQNIPLIGFFDEKLFKENKQAKKNYKLSKDIYGKIRDFDLLATSKSKDSSVFIGLTKNTNKVIFTQRDKNLKDSYIEVKNYNQKTNEFEILYHNIQLNVEFHRQSKFITDLDKGDLKLHLITKPSINVKRLKNIKLKTKTTEYFSAIEILKDSLGYNAKLNLLLR